jgi:hypothetical protein
MTSGGVGDDQAFPRLSAIQHAVRRNGRLLLCGARRMTLAEIIRMIRAAIQAARKEGAAVVEVQINDAAIVRIPLTPEKPVAESEEIDL